MPCYYPLDAWRSTKKNPSGKYGIVFVKDQGEPGSEMLVPCGQCIGCRLERSRQWAMRCVHESSLYEENCFLTLTYNDENLPPNSSLLHEDFQLFMKRLRKKYGAGIRYYMCGEYGEEQDEELYKISPIGRPHFHACIFNHDFPDKMLWKTINDIKLYTSEDLDGLWNKGYATIGDVTFESAAYVARYIMKKRTGKQSDEHYNRGINYETGEIKLIEPEYTQMSRRPGIAKKWWDEFNQDTFKDFVTVRGIKMKPPKYYDRCLEAQQPERMLAIKEKRALAAIANIHEQHDLRRKTKQEIKLRQINRLVRNKQS